MKPIETKKKTRNLPKQNKTKRNEIKTKRNLQKQNEIKSSKIKSKLIGIYVIILILNILHVNNI